MYKLCIFQDEYREMYDRRYPITIVMPNNGEKENNISKNQLICDIVNNTHKFPFRVFEEYYIYFRKPCMSNAIIRSIFTERVCKFPRLQEELKKPSSLLTIVLDGYDDVIKKQANKFHTFLSNCFSKIGHKVYIIIIKCEVFDYPIPKSVKNDTRNNIILHSGNVFFMPCSFNNWTKEYYRDIKRLQTLLGGKKFTSLHEKVVKMRNMAYSFVRLECGTVADISPLSPTFKYTLPLEIKDLLLEYHSNKFPLILNYSHSSKYRVDFYKIQNPYRNWCDVTCNICMGSRQIPKCARKVSSYNMGKKQFKRYRYKYSFL